tara:strand:- start:260 stop:496 length:237 start_codon:yes stop_codon:yes gene_type:complete
MQTTEQEFKRLYVCDFKQDERLIALDAELEKYYNATETCDHKTAQRHWKIFNDWRNGGGYTQEEVNRAKRRVINRLGI